MKNSGEQAKIDHRRYLIATLYHQGYKTQQQIADALAEQYQISVTQRTVSNDMKAVRLMWQDSAVQEIAELRAELKAEYDLMKREYWQAWIKSQQVKEVEISKQTTGGGSGDDRLEAQIRKEAQVGDPAYMQGVERVNKAIREIFGVDAAAKVEQSGNIGLRIEYVNDWRNNQPTED